MERLKHQKDVKQNPQLRTYPQCRDVPHHATAAPAANKMQLLSPKIQQIFCFVDLIAGKQTDQLRKR